MKRQIIDVRCDHCGARPSKPCRSVGDRVIVEAHMARVNKALGKGWGEAGTEAVTRAARDAYARQAFWFVFGRFDQTLFNQACRDRSIDPKKKWVRDALAGVGQRHPQATRPEKRREAKGAQACYQLALEGLL